MKSEGKLDHVIDPDHPHFDRYKSHNKQYLHDYIIVIDAGSKGSRAHLYRTKPDYQQLEERKEKRDHEEGHDDEESNWKTKINTNNDEITNYISIELVKSKKIKPGIAEFKDDLPSLHSKYFGKLLNKITNHVPKSQRYRTPIFVHATGGMRLLDPENQQSITQSICEYLQNEQPFFLPDCKTHVNVIEGELEGLYSWIGVNYLEGVFNYDYDLSAGNYGIVDLGGASTQLAFSPSFSQSNENNENLYKLQLHYNANKNRSALSYDVYSQSYLGGMNLVKQRYQAAVLESDSKEDPCLSKGLLKFENGIQITGTGDFEQCLDKLSSLLTVISKERYCPAGEANCDLASYLPFKNLKFENVKNFIGINEFHDSLKDFSNYEEFYTKTVNLCNTGFDTSKKKDKHDDDDDEYECFQSTWIINILHQSLDFPLLSSDSTLESTSSTQSQAQTFQILKDFTWTYGRAVLYQYDSIAQMQSSKPHQEPVRVGYFEPRSNVFTYGGEQDGVSARPSAKSPYEEVVNDEDDDDKDNDAWDHVVENHRLYGGLIILVMLLGVLYLLFGRKYGITQRFKKAGNWVKEKIGRRVRFTKLSDFDDLESGVELSQFEREIGSVADGAAAAGTSNGDAGANEDDDDDDDGGRKDSFEI